MKHSKKILSSAVALFLSLVLILSGCGSSVASHVNTKKENDQIPTEVSNSKAAIADGTLNYGVGSTSPYEGIFNPIFDQTNIDQAFVDIFYPSLFKKSANNDITNGGAADVAYSKDHKTVTVTLNKKLNWTDGKPVTADDYIFAYYVVGSKDYPGFAYTSVISKIIGMDAYHNGKTKTISGIKKVNNKTVEISYAQPDPNILSNLLSTPLEKSAFAGIPIAKMASSAPVRKHPVGYGPFKIQSTVPGESVTFVRNDDYFAGKPKLKTIYASIVNPDLARQKLQSGQVDIVDYPSVNYNPKTVPSNVNIIALPEVSHFDLAFKLGSFDKTKNENVSKPDGKMANRNLRQAMGYALNNAEVGRTLYKGLRIPATSYIAPGYKTFHDSSIKGYYYDPAKAKKLLDQAGYKDVNKDGYREDPSGKKLVIYLGASSGGVQGALTKYYIQNWKSVGLDVKLVNNRLLDFDNFYQRLEADDPGIDVYITYYATTIDPTDQFGRQSSDNLTRYTSSENDALIQKINSAQSLDTSYRQKVLYQWQQLIQNDAPEIPLFYTYSLVAVNKRVTHYSVYENRQDYYCFKNLGVTSNTPVKAK